MADLSFLTNQVEEARHALQEAIRAADVRDLTGTAAELRRALARVRFVIFEINSKEQPEFAPFRDPVGTPQDTSK